MERNKEEWKIVKEERDKIILVKNVMF